MIDIKEYLKQTKTVLLTQDAFDELKQRASVQPKRTEKRTETHACDCISRADVEQTVEDNILCYTHSDRPIDQDPDTECHKAIRMALRMLRKDLRKLPSVQPQRTDEWCTDCAEYDSEKHCCPRFNRVIRQTLSEQPKIIHCRDCKYADEDIVCQNDKGLAIQDGDDFCSFAEGRTDE